MSEQDNQGNNLDTEQDAQLQSLQLAYDTSYHVHRYATNTPRNNGMKTLFAIAAGTGTSLILDSTLVPMMIINAGFIYEAYQNRIANLRLTRIFNEVSADLDSNARSHMQPIAKKMKNTKLLDFKELQLEKQFQTNPVNIGLAAFAAIAVPGLLPAALAAMIGYKDKSDFEQAAKAARAVGEELQRLHGDKLSPPPGSQPPSPK